MPKVKIENSTISVVMYHYVREVKKSRYPNLKALEYSNFKNQINFFRKNFNILSNNDFNEIISTKKIPLKPSVFLTFDDGYIDHYKYVFPYLKKKKIKANFYPPTKVIQNKTILDVNKIQFIIEREQNSKKILKEIDYLLIKEGKKPISDEDRKKINLNSRFDDKETTLVKRILQHYLPQKLREKITNLLFKKILNISVKDFSKSLYMNKKQIKEMYNESMSFGLHGDYHYWWKYLRKNDQEKEIKNSINYFKKIKLDINSPSVCFPYGSYNKETLKLLIKYNISYALTTKPGIISNKNLTKTFTYPRLDTNDFPS